MDKRGIYWLASYPKSGNTWLRIILSNLLYPALAPVDINDIPVTAFSAVARSSFDEITGLPSSDLTSDEVRALRADVCRWVVRKNRQTLFVKTHEAAGSDGAGVVAIPEDVTLGAVYIVRNPFDIAVSYAHHLQLSIDVAIDHLCNRSRWLCDSPSKLAPQLPQQVSSWSGHIDSWLSSPIATLLVRYEDLSRDPSTSCRRIVDFLGLNCGDSEITTALAHSSFERLQQQEQCSGFMERFLHSQHFFRSGTVGGWRQFLDRRQVDRLVGAQRAWMIRLGYLDERDNPTI